MNKFTPSDGFLLDTPKARETDKSPELLEIEWRQAQVAARAHDPRIVETDFTLDELKHLGSPIDPLRLVKGHTRPHLTIVKPVSNVVALRRERK